jgi:hypothetical protein
MRKPWRRWFRRYHGDIGFEELLKIIKAQEKIMLAQVDALTATAATLKTTVDSAIAALGTTDTAADLAALTAVNDSLTATNAALAAALAGQAKP